MKIKAIGLLEIFMGLAWIYHFGNILYFRYFTELLFCFAPSNPILIFNIIIGIIMTVIGYKTFIDKLNFKYIFIIVVLAITSILTNIF